mgnify:CR=1 FL=1
MASPLRSVAAVVVSSVVLALTACSSSSVVDDDDGAGGDGGGGGAPLTEDGEPGLLGCGLPLACDAIVTHISHEPSWAPACVAELVVGGGAGAVQHTSAPGPYDCASQSIYVFLGDGTAIRQSRNKPGCQSPGPHFFGDATPPELCQVVVPAELADACDDPPQMTTSAVSGGPWIPGCEATPGELVDGCQPIDALTCAEALAFIPE